MAATFRCPQLLSPFQVAGDMLFQDAKFDMAQVLNYFRLHGDGDLAIYYQMEPEEKTSTRGIVTVDVRSNK